MKLTVQFVEMKPVGICSIALQLIALTGFDEVLHTRRAGKVSSDMQHAP
jgi:hypothetical protein